SRRCGTPPGWCATGARSVRCWAPWSAIVRGPRSSRCSPSRSTFPPCCGRSTTPKPRPGRPGGVRRAPAPQPERCALRAHTRAWGPMRTNIAGVVALGPALGLGPAPAWALNFFELEVYPATTEGAGQHEIESLTSFVANGRNAEGETHHLLRTSLEYNYGLTDKIDVAAYTDLEKRNGDELEYAGSRFRARGALWDKGRFPLDLGWYLEAEVPYHAESDLELEFRPLVSRDLGRFSIDLNPAFELPTVSEER